jgi:hypothetical protein
MRRQEPWSPDLEDVLRRALRTLADSVVPGADGLDRIRAQIRAQRQVPPSWAMAELAPPGVRRMSASHQLQRARSAARALWDLMIRRFRLGPEPVSWHRWLRPAAALATAIFVVSAGSLAIAALPRLIWNSSSSSPTGSGPGQVPVGVSTGPGARHASSQYPNASSGRTRPSAGPHGHSLAPSTGPRSASTAPSPSPSPYPPASGSPSSSPSPSATSPSPSPSPSASCSPSPSPSPTARGKHGGTGCHRRRHHHGG